MIVVPQYLRPILNTKDDGFDRFARVYNLLENTRHLGKSPYAMKNFILSFVYGHEKEGLAFLTSLVPILKEVPEL